MKYFSLPKGIITDLSLHFNKIYFHYSLQAVVFHCRLDYAKLAYVINES